MPLRLAVAASMLLSACGARSELLVPGASDAGAMGVACPGLPPPPSCPAAGNPWLLFDYGSGGDGFHIYAVRADGTQFHQLSLLPQHHAPEPAATPDGARILYVSTEDRLGPVHPAPLHARHGRRPAPRGHDEPRLRRDVPGRQDDRVRRERRHATRRRGREQRPLSSPTPATVDPRFAATRARCSSPPPARRSRPWIPAGDVTPLIAGSGGYSQFGLSPDGATVVTATTCAQTGLDGALRAYPFDALPLAFFRRERHPREGSVAGVPHGFPAHLEPRTGSSPSCRAPTRSSSPRRAARPGA